MSALLVNLRHRRSEVTVFTPFCLFVCQMPKFILASILLGSVKSFSVCLSVCMFVTCEKKKIFASMLVCLFVQTFVRCRNLFRHLSCSVPLRVFLFVCLSVCWPDPKDCPYYCLRLFVCLCVCLSVCVSVCVSVVHPPSAQVLQSILMKLGQMDQWGTQLCTLHIGPDPPPRGAVGGQF